MFILYSGNYYVIVIHYTMQIHNDVRGSVTMNASPAMQRLFGKPIHSDFSECHFSERY